MSPHVIKLCCQSCGSDLEVADDVRFLTCNYCHSKLEIVRDVSATHTRVLEKLERTTDRIAGNLKVIELQNDLERLDREWESTRESMLVRGKNGSVSEPSAVSSIIGGLVMAGFGFFFLVTAASNGAPGIFPLAGLGFAAFGIYLAISGPAKAGTFQTLQQQHLAERERLIARIEEERNA